jgi:trans-2,3-dihydro-3-hydroxyanthranilate isomerase
VREYVIADVFTSVPLEGNPVAVFCDGDGLSAELMQRTARELNLSETVFVLASDSADEHARVRIFTPSIELPFAGHPVLGTAFVLADRLGLDVVRMRTGSGPVSVAVRRADGRIVFGEMEQPIPTWEPFGEADRLLVALGVQRSRLPVDVYDNGPRHTFVELPDVAAVASLRPDLRAVGELGRVGVSCFALQDGGRVRPRMVGPGLGVAEDPATGSAAGPLAVHLARHGRTAFGQRIEIRQGVEIGRPSLLEAVVEGSAERVERVGVGGAAVIVARGEFRLD